MTNYLPPTYLSSLLPPLVGAMFRYPLRNIEQYQTNDAKSQLYYNSFLLSAIHELNALGNTVQFCPSVSSFKRKMSTRQPVPNYYYLTGSQNGQILRARIRTIGSSLNYTLFSQKHNTRQVLYMWRNWRPQEFTLLLCEVHCPTSNYDRKGSKTLCPNS